MRIATNSSPSDFGHVPLFGVATTTLMLLVAGLCLADDGKGMSASYLAGLDALSAGRWPDALGAFTKAVDADEENADYRTARGVALALSQQFPAAIKELQRSLRLRADDWETKLWLSAAYKMGGDPAKGAQYLVYGPPSHGRPEKADLDYSILVSAMSQHYWQANTNGQYVDYKTKQSMSTKDIAAAEFPRASAMFAQRRQGAAPPELAGALLDRIKENMKNRQYADALKDLDSLLASAPEDDALLLLHAEAALSLGDYSGSRTDYTRVLTDQPTWADAYLGRAQAAAHLADSERARADLAVATKLGAKDVDAIRQEVDRALAGIKAQNPAEARAQFEKAAREGLGEPKLVELALAVEQAVNAHRLRYDETYQNRLRALDEARRATPKNPDCLADLADFLFAESNAPFEQVEPRSWPVYYRYVPQAVAKFSRTGEFLPAPPAQRTAREVARASGLLDEALKINPNHVRSLGIMGVIFNSKGEYGQAKDVLDKAVALKPNDFALLRERSVAEQGIAREDELAANALEMPRITRTNNMDGTETVTTVNPSGADMARAAQLHREAKESHQKAVDDMAKTMKLTAGTAMNSYYQGLTDYAYHDVKQAQTDFGQAIKLDPKFRDAWEQLAKVDWELNLPEEWAAAREGEMSFIQTTAAPWLVAARARILQTKFKTAREALAAARQLDPTDARGDVYQAVIDADNDKPDAAIAGYRMAIALEEARALLHGRNLVRAGPLPVESRDIGLTLALRNRAAALLFQQGQTDGAFGLFQANVAFLSHLPPEKLATPVPQAALPSSTIDPNTIPINETYAGLKFRAQAGLDYTAWARRYHDPSDVALASQTYNRLVVDFNVTDPKPDVLQAVISLGLAELQVSKGNFAEAKELLRNEGATPQPLWQEMRKVESQANQTRQSAR
jgi:tetratricopeptide (TPR) repeat protein